MKILFICGSLNQTTIMHQISEFYNKSECFFTPYYGDAFINYLADKQVLDFSILGGQFRKNTLDYLAINNLQIDYRGNGNDYDLVFTCSDLLIPSNIKDKKLILVQEGMTDPENLMYRLVRTFKLPRYFASTSTTGLSNSYNKFCIASEGYKEFFKTKGIDEKKLVITGLPNFDNCKLYCKNEFPYKDYVLVATSDTRETFKFENRKKFILNALDIADGREIIFKLHPNENVERATAEIKKYAPGSKIFSDGNTNEMIANCKTLITKYSSVVYIGLALGKEVYSDFDINLLKKLTPVQNDGSSAKNIAEVGKMLLLGTEKIKTVNTINIKTKLKEKFLRGIPKTVIGLQ